MSDELTLTTASPSAPDGATSTVLRRVLRQSAITIVAFAVAGVVCGVLWEWFWRPAQGVVYKHAWYPISWDRAQPAQFAGAAWYVVIGIVAGLALGLVASRWLAEAELATLGAVVVGGIVAALLMWAVGLHLSPADPNAIAAHAANGLRLPSRLRLGDWGLLAAFPGGAVAGAGAMFLTTQRPGAFPVVVGGSPEPAPELPGAAGLSDRSEP